MAGLLILGQFVTGCKKTHIPFPPGEVDKIKHVVVIYLENHSFDNLYAKYPGVGGGSDLDKEDADCRISQLRTA